MKFFRILAVLAFIAISVVSCKKEGKEKWNIEVETNNEKVLITDISKEFFDANIPLEQFKAKYPWFQGSVKDEDFENRRKNPEEIKAYKDAASKIDLNKLSEDLTQMFARIKHYFPKFENPKVYTFSSSTQMYQEPVLYDPQQGFLFIDISSFMGEKSVFYKGIEEYFKTSMNPENLLPKTSEAIAFTIVPFTRNEQKFIDQIVYNGKLMTLQDAFIPNVPDHLKMSATSKQFDWNNANEAQIWDYFVENDYLFSPDPRLVERFVAPGPFSKFYTEIDKESSPQVGIFTGWKICQKFFDKNPDVKLQDFINMNATEIFNQSEYKPKK